MSGFTISRRAAIAGATSFAAAAGVPLPARALAPALFTGISRLVLLWNGVKMVEEIYKRLFAGRRDGVTREVVRIYNGQQIIINNYYNFGDSAGCECLLNRLRAESTSLIVGGSVGAVSLPAGCIIALDEAAAHLRRSYSEPKVLEYTKPFKSVTPAEPWREIDASGSRLISDLSYYSVGGSVGLRWEITDRNRRLCRGAYEIRDDRSKATIARGVTSEFLFS